MFTFTNKSNEFALRSDLSVMSLLKYVESGSKKKKKWWYQGEIFRKNENNESPIYNQLGFEILGSTNQKKDDEEILNSAIKIVNKLNWRPLVNFKKGLEKTFLWYLHNIQYFRTIKRKDIIKRLGFK